MVTVPHIMVGLERMLDYRGVGLERFHCIHCHVVNNIVCFTQQLESITVYNLHECQLRM